MVFLHGKDYPLTNLPWQSESAFVTCDETDSYVVNDESASILMRGTQLWLCVDVGLCLGELQEVNKESRNITILWLYTVNDLRDLKVQEQEIITWGIKEGCWLNSTHEQELPWHSVRGIAAEKTMDNVFVNGFAEGKVLQRKKRLIAEAVVGVKRHKAVVEDKLPLAREAMAWGNKEANQFAFKIWPELSRFSDFGRDKRTVTLFTTLLPSESMLTPHSLLGASIRKRAVAERGTCQACELKRTLDYELNVNGELLLIGSSCRDKLLTLQILCQRLVTIRELAMAKTELEVAQELVRFYQFLERK